MAGTLIGHWIYLLGIGGIVMMRFLPQLAGARSAQPIPGIFTQVLGLVAVADYIASLWVEKSVLARAPQGQTVAPIITAAFGVSIAIYGIIVWLLGAAAAWFWGFVGLAALHWFHSAVRWSKMQAGR
jgi:hypothetical protein